LPILTLKLVAMATSLEPSEKDGQISNLRWNINQFWKFGENWSSRSWCNFVQIL